MLVLDEADEMLSKGFKEQIYDVYRYLPPTTQGILFIYLFIYLFIFFFFYFLSLQRIVFLIIHPPPPPPPPPLFSSSSTLSFFLSLSFLSFLVVLVSATLPREVLQMTTKFMNDPIRLVGGGGGVGVGGGGVGGVGG